MREIVAFFGFATVGATTLSCVSDVVLPNHQVTATCGNGVIEQGETCDVVGSAGCVACNVVPGWTCTTTSCTATCGDGVIADDAACTISRRDTTVCNMTGYWAARQSTYLREPILNGVQVSSNWFFFRLAQDEVASGGESFRVVDALDCGILVTGSATVRYTPGSLRAIANASGMDGKGVGGHAARRGIARGVPGGGCFVSFDRWYAVRGLTPAFLPGDFLAKPELSSLPALPAVADPGVAAPTTPPGVTDPDADTLPGLGFQIEGIVSGVRSSVQRDWKEFTMPPGASVPASAMSFVIPGAFDLQESILRVTECGNGCGLLGSIARVAQDIPARIELSFIGLNLDGPRVRQVARRAPGIDVNDDLTTCANVRLLMPHDPSTPSP
jgi:hypothetical protein